MMEKHDFTGWCMQDRQEQWAATGECPRGLSVESAAYRYGGFGTNEMVVYYDMVRWLIWFCREEASKVPTGTTVDCPEGAAFVKSESARLASLREAWLDQPDGEYEGRTARSIIHNERARVPEGMTGAEAMIDHDCPLCQMMADSPGPVFWGLDGCNMDEDFAFSIDHRTCEEWEQEQRAFEESSRRWEEQRPQGRGAELANPAE